jgi:hypothetical protein
MTQGQGRINTFAQTLRRCVPAFVLPLFSQQYCVPGVFGLRARAVAERGTQCGTWAHARAGAPIGGVFVCVLR